MSLLDNMWNRVRQQVEQDPAMWRQKILEAVGPDRTAELFRWIGLDESAGQQQPISSAPGRTNIRGPVLSPFAGMDALMQQQPQQRARGPLDLSALLQAQMGRR